MPPWTYFYIILFWPLLALSVLLAIRWGGAAERQANIIYAGACCLEVLLIWSEPSPRFSHFNVGIATVDIGLAIGLTILTVRHGLAWLYAVNAIQILTALSHFTKFILPDISAMAYTILSGAGGYPQVLLLILGTVMHARAERRSRAELPDP